MTALQARKCDDTGAVTSLIKDAQQVNVNCRTVL